MGFDDLLRRRLGPMREFIDHRARPDPEPIDPERLYYRRAVGVEARIRLGDSWAEIDLSGHERERRSWDRAKGLAILGLTEWTHASEIALSPKDLWSAVEEDLLFWSRKPERVRLTGTPIGIPKEHPIARRRSMWPTPLIDRSETVSAFPFMPRGKELVGAELAGVRFSSLERGFEVMTASVTAPSRRAGLLRRLLLLLDGTRTAEEILAESADPSEAKWLLELLASITAIEVARSSAIREGLLRPARPQVTWLGHAAVLLQASGKNILVDPLFFAASDPEEPHQSAPRFDPRDLPPIDLVLVTHGDNDHLNPNTLLQLDPHTPVVIPKLDKQPPAYQVDLRGVLRVLGFDRVIELDEGEHYDLGAIRVSAWPFEGESWELDLAKATYLVESPDVSAFFAADSFRMDETYRTLGARDRRIDLAFMGVSGCAESFAMPAAFGYGNFYADWIVPERRNEWVQHCSGPEDAFASLQILKPRFAFGYAAGGASYIKTEYSDRGDHTALARLLEGVDFGTQSLALAIGVPTALP
jgi:L-ascorbate metabolism protein UlaG (beta-lactamase superfamily)